MGLYGNDEEDLITQDFEMQDYPTDVAVPKASPKEKKAVEKQKADSALKEDEKKMLQKALMRYKPKKPNKETESGSARFNIWLSDERRADLELLPYLMDKNSQTQLFVDYLDDLRLQHADLIKAMREQIKR